MSSVCSIILPFHRESNMLGLMGLTETGLPGGADISVTQPPCLLSHTNLWGLVERRLGKQEDGVGTVHWAHFLVVTLLLPQLNPEVGRGPWSPPVCPPVVLPATSTSAMWPKGAL